MNSAGADYFVKKELDTLLNKDPEIDTIVLGCTHYPILLDSIKKYLPKKINVLCQGPLVAESLADYLQRHPEMDSRLSTTSSVKYLTTEHNEKFDSLASLFLGKPVLSHTITISE